MHVVAEMLAAMVVWLAAATISWFGLALESRDSGAERSVRRVSTAPSSAPEMVKPRPDPDAPVPC